MTTSTRLPSRLRPLADTPVRRLPGSFSPPSPPHSQPARLRKFRATRLRPRFSVSPIPRFLLLLPLLLFSLFLSIPAAHAIPAASDYEIAPGVVLVRAEFGIFEEASDGTRTFKPTSTVPLVVGQEYGWRLHVRTTRSSVDLEEEFELPAAPKLWSGDPSADMSLSSDNRIATSKFSAPIEDGVIERTWKVVEGDPAGDYKIRISFHGERVRTFNFTVISGK